MKEPTIIGFIGQGFIGKNYADDFVNRGYQVIRYDLDQYQENKEKIKECAVVFIAVPTPTTPQGFDDSIVQDALSIIKPGSTVIIKSTLKVGTTQKLQIAFPDLTIMHSPEFLRAKYATEDAKQPNRNIIGITDLANPELKKKAEAIMSLLPKAPYELITKSSNAELIKYGGNCFLYFKVVFMNMLYDLIEKYDLDYKVIKEAMSQDPRIGSSHMDIIHESGRGAGGFCFIKDFEVFITMLKENELLADHQAAEAIRNINLTHLKNSKKDLDLIKGVYGE